MHLQQLIIPFKNDLNQHPITLIDVGASGGIQPIWHVVEDYIKVIGFEPDINEFENLKKIYNPQKYVFFNTGLLDKKGISSFYITRKQQVSSIFKPNRSFLDKFPNSERFDILQEAKIEVNTLDCVLKENDILGGDFMKLDTQGSELLILQGSRDVLRKSIFGVEVEVEFSPMYLNQPLFSDVDKFMREMGFELWALKNQYNLFNNSGETDFRNRHHQLIFSDAIYFKSRDVFMSDVNQLHDKSLKDSAIKKYVIVSLLFGYFQLALEVMDLSPTIFSQNQVQCVQRYASTLKFMQEQETQPKRPLAFIRNAIRKIKSMVK